MKRLLVVVDYQNDFVDGALGFPGAEKLEKPIVAKIKEYRERADKVIFTLDTHLADYLDTQEGLNLPVEHCIEGTPGHRLYGAVEVLATSDEEVFRKPTFGSEALFDSLCCAQRVAAEMGKLPFESIELVGLVSNICVVANAVLAKTACPEVPIIIDAACTASHDAKLNDEVLDIMEGLQMQVINR